MARKSKGRQKIQMTRMSKESNLLVTFSKRRSGLFKKAYELHTLCGIEIGIIVFSPGKKVFSYGHPCLYSLIDRFLTGKSAPSTSSSQLVEAHRSASIQELNKQLTEMLNQLEIERKYSEEFSNLRKASQGRCWWEAPTDQLGQDELEQLKVAMEELKKNVAKQVEKLTVQVSNTRAFLGAPSSKGGGHNSPSNVVHHHPPDVKVPLGLGLSMTPQGFTLGYSHGFF
ncbi:OLC1v1001795C1 [Oldenlandia corymbosa var. corymbosa]|uniref:OLC1v1001795C1 n=1 Tax=Oldenlandia corymbosa var. corymbosa TaxID=529605 RepID=A0AAV1D9J6_OLDCO|nr:OLC1v1001795C1 [Oldenlandia corymbosa var. corymbosa]